MIQPSKLLNKLRSQELVDKPVAYIKKRNKQFIDFPYKLVDWLLCGW